MSKIENDQWAMQALHQLITKGYTPEEVSLAMNNLPERWLLHTSSFLYDAKGKTKTIDGFDDARVEMMKYVFSALWYKGLALSKQSITDKIIPIIDFNPDGEELTVGVGEEEFTLTRIRR